VKVNVTRKVIANSFLHRTKNKTDCCDSIRYSTWGFVHPKRAYNAPLEKVSCNGGMQVRSIVVTNGKNEEFQTRLVERTKKNMSIKRSRRRRKRKKRSKKAP
jgi:hypothetical protein